jgi:filamentous hemagglutinin family protein
MLHAIASSQRPTAKDILFSSSSLYRRAFASLTAMVTAVSAHDAAALPTNPQVESGTISVSQPSANDLVIHQGSDRAIINWQNFDILHGESTRFIQPNAGSIALNRVRDGNPTQILGKLSANGKLVLVNPNGVFFGAGSTVDVAGLVATTADISSSNFLAGRMQFDRAGSDDASIINEGRITATDGGLVALVAPGVRNSGIIQANLGTVALAGGKTFAVDMYGDGLYSFAVDGKIAKAARDQNGNAMDSAVENSGSITAQGGKVLLTANAAKDIVSNVVNNRGVIEARAARVEGGTVILDGGSSGNVRVAGKIDASGKGAGQKGGSVTVRGEHIELASADIDASGATGGGVVRIGGAYINQSSWEQAKSVIADELSKIDVSALDSGDAGSSIIWSDDVTKFAGILLGKGGAIGGNGGLVEVSSKGELKYSGRAEVQAVNGLAGTLLLDPTNIIIDAAMALATQATLNAGGNVVMTTAAAGGQAGDIFVNSAINWFGTGSLTLNALHDILVNSDIISTATGTNTQGSITLNATNNVFMNNATIRTAHGAIDVIGRKVALATSVIRSFTGDIVINNSRGFSSNTANSVFNDPAGAAKVWINQSPDGSIQNVVDAIGTTGTGGAKVTLGAGYWSEQVFLDQGNFTLTGQGDTTVVRAPSVLASRLTARGLNVEPIIYVDNAPNVSVSKMQVIGDDVANVGIGFHRSNNGSVTNTLVRNVNGDGIFFDLSRNSVIQNNRVDSTIARPTLEMGNGIQVKSSHGTLIDNNTVSNIGWDAIKVDGGIGYNVTNNTIRNVERVGISAAGVSDTLIANNRTTQTNTNLSGFGAITVVGGSSNLTLQGNIIKDVVRGVGILMNSVTGTNLIAGNIINKTESHGIQVLRMPGVQIVDNFVGYLNTLGWSAGVDNIGGNGIHVEFSNDAIISRNSINETKPTLALQHGNGIYLRSSHGVMIGGENPLDGNIIRNTGWDGIKIAGATGQRILNNRITNAERVGIYAAGVTSMEIAGNVLNNIASGVTGYGGIAVDGGSANLTVANNHIFDVKHGSGIRLNSINGNNSVSGNEIARVEQDGIEVYNTQNLSVLNNAISVAGRDGIHLEGILNANVDNNVIHNVGRDGIYAINLSVSAPDIMAFAMMMPAAAESRVTNNHIYAAGRDGIHLENIQNAFVDHNLIHNVGGNGIYAYNLSTVGMMPVFMPYAEVMFPTPWSSGPSSSITANTIYGAGLDGIHAQSVSNSYIANNIVHDISLNGIWGYDLMVDWSESSIVAGNDIYRTGMNGIDLSFVTNAYVVNNTIHDVGSAYFGGGLMRYKGFGYYGNGINAVNLYTTGSVIPYFANREPMMMAAEAPIDTTYYGVSGKTTISDNNIFRITNDGIHVENAQNAVINNNHIRNLGNDGIFARNLYIAGGMKTKKSIMPMMMMVEPTTEVTDISYNHIYATGHDGIHLESIENAHVTHNNIHDLRHDGIFASDLYVSGAAYPPSSPPPTSFLPPLAGFDSVGGGDAPLYELPPTSMPPIPAPSMMRSVIANNQIEGVGHDGIHLEGIEYATVTGNTIRRATNDGIFASNLVSPPIGDSVFGGDYMYPMIAMGPIFEPAGYNDSYFANNDVRLVGNDAIHLESMDNAEVASNFIQWIGGSGIEVLNSDDTSVHDNTVEGGSFGLRFDNSFSPNITNNRITSSAVGADLRLSDGADLSGNIFNGSVLGVNLDNSVFARLSGETFFTPVEGVGLRITNGSHGTIVNDSSFNGGNVAIEINGEGSDMVFEGTNSRFAGNNYYFVLQNGAMFGETLDASQQIFDGVRATDFTLAQLIAAEGRTIDVEDALPIGDVFYKSLGAFPTFDQAVLDEFQNQRRNLYRRANFSYAGRAFNLTTDPIEPGSFDTTNINLSLLNRASPQAAVDIANLFATLAPAAGGNNPSDPQSLNDLAPAAGGNNPQSFASLSPSAGGGAAGGSCANDFLGGGFQSGFQCNTQQ